MSRFRGGSTRFLLAEFIVISLGVVVALGADRWVQGLDNSERGEPANVLRCPLCMTHFTDLEIPWEGYSDAGIHHHPSD